MIRNLKICITPLADNRQTIFLSPIFLSTQFLGPMWSPERYLSTIKTQCNDFTSLSSSVLLSRFGVSHGYWLLNRG